MALPEPLTDPVPLAVLTLLIVGLVHYQRTLTWSEYRALHRLKVRLVPFVDRYTTAFVLSRKGYRNDPEHIDSREQSVKTVWKRLVRAGGSPHLINSVKVRQTPDGETQYSAAHVVWLHADGTQTEVYLFANGDGTTDVYAHHEVGVTDPDGHLSAFQHDGDPKGVVWGALTATTEPAEIDA